MQIGEVSKQAGISIGAIRFYERSGLLAEPQRTEGGFRLYSLSDLSTLQFIQNLQVLGFSLNEIREFLSLRRNDIQACSKVRNMLDHKLRDVHAKRIALGKLEAELRGARSRCNAELKRSRRRRDGRCPVLSDNKDSKRSA